MSLSRNKPLRARSAIRQMSDTRAAQLREDGTQQWGSTFARKPAKHDAPPDDKHDVPRTGRPKRTRPTNDFSPAADAAIKTRSGGRCEWWTDCPNPATDRAHRENRNPRNGHASNALHLCREHHIWTHDHRPEANELGARVSDGKDYRAIPVLTRHSQQKVWLADDGTWSTTAPEEAAA